MTIAKKASQKIRQQVSGGLKTSTGTLSASPSVEVVEFGAAMAKVSWSSTGTLAGNIEFSINGQTWFSSTAFVAGTPGSFSAHNVNAVRVTRTGGTGELAIAATA